MKIIEINNVPAIIGSTTEGNYSNERMFVSLLFTPTADVAYPLSVAIPGKNLFITVPMDQLIEKVKNDIKEGKL